MNPRMKNNDQNNASEVSIPTAHIPITHVSNSPAKADIHINYDEVYYDDEAYFDF